MYAIIAISLFFFLSCFSFFDKFNITTSKKNFYKKMMCLSFFSFFEKHVPVFDQTISFINHSGDGANGEGGDKSGFS